MREGCDLFYFLEPVHERVAFAVPPKTGCTSIRQWLWFLTYGSHFVGDHIHQTMPDLQVSRAPLPESVKSFVAVHREGVGRMRSAYDHRIRDKGEAEDRGIEHYAENLQTYCDETPVIRHHSIPQSCWLGNDLAVFTDIVPLSQIDRLPELLAPIIGRPLPGVPHSHVIQNKSKISAIVRANFEAWCARDLEIGWDGKIQKGRILTL